MPLKPSKDQKAYLYDMLESAQKALGYLQGVTYDEFWQSSEKRDAVAMRIAAIGEAARQITPVTEAAVPNVPFHLIRRDAPGEKHVNNLPWTSGRARALIDGHVVVFLPSLR